MKGKILYEIKPGNNNELDVGSPSEKVVCHPYEEGKILYEIKPGNNNELNKEISGTYVCKELILDLASWISPEFYFKCNRIIIEHFEKEYQKTIREKDDKIDELIRINKEIFKQNEETLKKNDELIKKNDKLLKELREMNGSLDEAREQLDEIQEELGETNNKLDRALPNHNVDPTPNTLKHHYILMKNKTDTNEFMFIRGQDKYIKNKRNQYKEEFEITIQQTKTPNPIDLVNRLKEKIQKINDEHMEEKLNAIRLSEEYSKSSPSGKRTIIKSAKLKNSKIIYRVNKITLLDYPEKDLINLVKLLDEEKYNV